MTITELQRLIKESAALEDAPQEAPRVDDTLLPAGTGPAGYSTTAILSPDYVAFREELDRRFADAPVTTELLTDALG